MKKIAISAISLVVLLTVMVLASHAVIKTTRYENRIWHGDNTVTATCVKEETKLLSGRTIYSVRYSASWYEGFEEFLTKDADGDDFTEIVFR